MGSQLKQIISFTAVASGATVALPHNINSNGIAYTPDFVEPSSSAFTVTANASTVTVTNTGAAAADCDVLLELWHSFERAFGPGTGPGNMVAGLSPRPFVGGGGGGSGERNPILWAPGGGGDATTWAEVMTFIGASHAPLLVYINASATIPVGVYNVNYANFICVPEIAGIAIDMADGAQIRNLGFIEGQMLWRSNSTAVTPLVWDPNGGSPNILLLRFNAIVENAGTVPMVEVPDGQFFVAAAVLNASVLISAGTPVFNLGAGSALIVGTFGALSTPNDFVSGPGTAVLLYQNLGGAPSPLSTNAGFVGTTIQNLLTGTSCTSPATRPVNPFGVLPVGAMVFDQSLGLTGQPIWWDGTQWVDATGAPA